MLIYAKNKVDSEALNGLSTPKPTFGKNNTISHMPIPHGQLVDLTRKALDRAGLEITEEEHALARGDLRYFGGFALKGEDMTGEDRKIVLGLRNAHDKSFAASVAIGNYMMVCENLCFSSDIKLARKHTRRILSDLPRVLSDAIGRLVSHWVDMETRIDQYKNYEMNRQQAADLIVELVDAKAFPARDIYKAVNEFRSPRHEEFKGSTLWTLYNSITENLKGGDLSRLPFRTMTMQTIFDKIVGHSPQLPLEVASEKVNKEVNEEVIESTNSELMVLPA